MRTFAALMSSGAGILALAMPAYGQAVPPQATPDVIEAQDATDGVATDSTIIVSARRREESVQDVPQTVNVVTAEQVEDLNLRNFRDIQEIVPGLTMQSTNSFSNRATVRGIAFVPEASGNNPSVEFYLNDAPIQSGFLFQSNFDFGQFELQRGPQGTLRGRAAPSGSIAVTTRRPDLDEAGAAFNATGSNLDAYKLDGAVNVPIIAGMLAVRLAGVVDEDRGSRVRSIKEQTDPLNNEGPFTETRALRGSIRFEPTDWLEAHLMAQTLETLGHSYGQVVSNSLYSGGPITTQLIRPFDRLSLEDQGSYDSNNQQMFIGNVDVRFAGQRLSYVGSYFKQEFTSIGGGDAADFFAPPRVATTTRILADPAGAVPACANGVRATNFRATTGTYFQCTYGKGSRDSHELRLASEDRIAGIFDYVIGGFYLHNVPRTWLTQETPVFLPPSQGGFTVSRTPIVRDAESTEKSVFGNLTAHLGNLELSGGLRFIDFEDFSGLVVSGATMANIRTKDSATIYSASAKYQLTPDFMIYALTGSSWRPGPRAIGNFSIGATGQGQTARELSFTNLPPESSKSYEAGIKTEFAGGRGRFNLAAYYQKFENYPYRGASIPYINFTATSPTGAVGNFNFLAAVPVEVKGIEGEASFQLTDRWSVSANAAYADGKITGGTIACLDLDRNGIPDTNAAQPLLADLRAALDPGQAVAACSDFEGPANTTPKFSANVQSELGFDLGTMTEGFVRGSASFYGATENSANNTLDDIDAYALLNLFAGIRDPDGAWSLTAFARNVFNHRHITSIGTGPLTASVRDLRVAGGFQNYTSEYRSISVTPPREFGVVARMAIGSR